jgi:uncharacterized membrane protein (DUF373 family)
MPEWQEHTPPAWVDRAIAVTEDVVYGVLAVVLVGGAALLIGDAVVQMIDEAGGDVETAVRNMLDRLLLAFILVELLGAVRATIRERRLVAEPFLLVGIIASIKEVVVESLNAREYVGGDDGKFADAMTSVGVQAGVLLIIGILMLLIRRKEREPEE